MRARPAADPIPVVPWDEFWPTFRRDYGSGTGPKGAQHVSIIGPTGTGKSTLAMEIASLRPWVAVLVSKPKDAHMARMLRAGGFQRAPFLPDSAAGIPRVYVWPPVKGTQSLRHQRAVFSAALDECFGSGGWTLVCDETNHLCEGLGLGHQVKLSLTMGRSMDFGLILAMHRPAWLPRDIYSAVQHVFIFGTNDEADLRSIGGLNGVNNRLIRETVGGLGRNHDCLYISTATHRMAITRLQK